MNIQQRNALPCGQQAVVIGASMAGLLAGRVLSEYFERVVIVERDTLPGGPEPRKGVPQGLHAHGLLSRGASVISEFFPDLTRTLLQEGATLVDPVADIHWYHFGVWKTRCASSIKMYCQSRPFLEYHVRNGLATKTNIRFLDECEVSGLRATDDKARIIGVQLRHRGDVPSDISLQANEREALAPRGAFLHAYGYETELAADLVVDASGRGSQAPKWLTSLGYAKVEEANVKVDVGYASRIYRCPEGIPTRWKMLAVVGRPPVHKRVGMIVPIEGDRWLVTLCGLLRDYPPQNEREFLEYARSLPVPDVYEALKAAEPVAPIFTHKFPSDRRRYYERMPRLPEGLLILGDALCSFNPVYGQGMTVAALEARALEHCLEQQQHSQGVSGLARRFQKAAAQAIDVPWLLATSEDFRFPEVEGYRPLRIRLLNWYTSRVIQMAAYHQHANLRFHQVMHMLKHPLILFEPALLFAVLCDLLRK